MQIEKNDDRCPPRPEERLTIKEFGEVHVSILSRRSLTNNNPTHKCPHCYTYRDDEVKYPGIFNHTTTLQPLSNLHYNISKSGDDHPDN